MKKIDLLLPDLTSYDVLKVFTLELKEAFLRAGVDARVIDLNLKTDVQTHLKDLPDFTLAFNGLLPDLTGKFLYDFTKVPHIAWLVDDPERFLPLVKQTQTVIITIDEAYQQKALKYNPRSFFLPHAIDPTRSIARDRERTIPCLMPASFIVPTNEEEEMEQQARSKALYILKDHPVHVAGKGGAGKGSTYLGEVPWNKMKELFQETKLVLQVTPKITSGGHERIFEALLAGALPLSTPNRFLATEFPSIPQYHSEQELLSLVTSLLNNEPERALRAQQALSPLLSHHTWDNRVQALLKILH